MGYACPVCDTPQRDERHLADHLALQALVHGGDHEQWLDTHEPDWESMNAERLGPLVAELADEHEFDDVLEDTVDRRSRGGSLGDDHGHGHGHSHGHGEQSHNHSHERAQPFDRQGEQLTGDAADIFEEARRLTREMEPGTDESADKDESGDDDTDKKET